MSEPAAFSYDAVSYPSAALPQAHPDRLATVAALFCLDPAPVERCRTLEVGCGDGTHLIAAALGLPQSTFVGVDLSAAAIDRGRELARELGLANVTLHHADLTTFTPDGSFDYITAHGFYSWVPSAVRDRLLALCRASLAPQGVAYVSYNTYPGCHIRRMLWEMMRFHTRHLPNPGEKIQQAVALLKFLADGQPKIDDAYGQLLREEFEQTADKKQRAVLYHDDLAELNDPVYFHEFAAHAARHGLRYLGEADFFEMQDHIYPPETVEALRGLDAQDVVLKEQYLDFLKGRRFRQTLLVHAGLSVDRHPTPERVRGFAAASLAQPASAAPDLGPGVLEEFRGARGAAMKIDHPLSKAAMLVLGDRWPVRLPFGHLVAEARSRLGPSAAAGPDDETALAEVLLGGYSAGLVWLHRHVPRFVRHAGPRPLASPLARAQLRRGLTVVSTLTHATVRLDDAPSRHLLALMDGTRDRPALVRDLAAKMQADGTPDADTAAFRDRLAGAVERNLDKAAAIGLLLE